MVLAAAETEKYQVKENYNKGENNTEKYNKGQYLVQQGNRCNNVSLSLLDLICLSRYMNVCLCTASLR